MRATDRSSPIAAKAVRASSSRAAASLGPRGAVGHAPGLGHELGPQCVVVHEHCGLLEVPLCLGRRAERGRALAGQLERAGRAPLQLRGVFGVGHCVECGEQVGCDHGCQLFVRTGRAQVVGGGEVQLLAIAASERLVGDAAHEVLEEAELTVLGRARVAVQRQHLLAHERSEQRIELRLVEPGQRCQRWSRERLPEHGGHLQGPALGFAQPVETGCDERVQRLRHLEGLDLGGRAVDVAVARERAAVEEHSHRLDRVQRHPFGPREDLIAQSVGKARDEAGEQRAHRVVAERLEVDRREVPLSGAPVRSAVAQLGPCQREHVDRVVSRPVEEVLDEVEQRRVGPLQVLEEHHDRIRVAQALEEEPPGGEEILTVAGLAVAGAEELCESRLEESQLGLVDELARGAWHAASGVPSRPARPR